MSGETTTYTSNVSYSLRQSILDTITNIAPTDCVFYNSIGKGKAKAKLEEWEEDTLQPAANNAQLEGMDVTATEITYPTRASNYTQISYKVFKISDTLDTVDKVGRASEIAYQTGRHMAMLKRDMEYDLLNTTASSAGSATAGRASCGAKGFVTTNFYSFSNSQASTNLITEDIFSDTHVLAWNQGGKPSLVITTMAQKRLISAFNGNNKITVTDDADGKKVINSVDVYEDDAGAVTVKASRFLSSDSTYYDWLFFIQPDMWDILFLKPIKTEKLARLGPSTTVMIDTEYTLRCKSEKANAAIKYLYNA